MRQRCEENPKFIRNLGPIDDTKTRDTMFNNLTKSLKLYRPYIRKYRYVHVEHWIGAGRIVTAAYLYVDFHIILFRFVLSSLLEKETAVGRQYFVREHRTERKFHRHYCILNLGITLAKGTKKKKKKKGKTHDDTGNNESYSAPFSVFICLFHRLPKIDSTLMFSFCCCCCCVAKPIRPDVKLSNRSKSMT